MNGTMTGEPMAAKKAAPKTGAKAAKPQAKAEGAASKRKPMVVQIRGSEEYKAWAEAMAEAEGFTTAMLFDRAIRAFAKQHGHPDAPKR